MIALLLQGFFVIVLGVLLFLYLRTQWTQTREPFGVEEWDSSLPHLVQDMNKGLDDLDNAIRSLSASLSPYNQGEVDSSNGSPMMFDGTIFTLGRSMRVCYVRRPGAPRTVRELASHFACQMEEADGVELLPSFEPRRLDAGSMFQVTSTHLNKARPKKKAWSDANWRVGAFA